MTFPPLPPAEAGTRLIDPWGMQGHHYPLQSQICTVFRRTVAAVDRTTELPHNCSPGGATGWEWASTGSYISGVGRGVIFAGRVSSNCWTKRKSRAFTGTDLCPAKLCRRRWDIVTIVGIQWSVAISHFHFGLAILILCSQAFLTLFSEFRLPWFLHFLQ